MSTAPVVYVRDNKARSDVNAVPGSDTNDGSTDALAIQTYGHMLDLINDSPAGSEFYLADGCAFEQSVNFRFNNPNTVTAVINLSFDGTHCILETVKPNNATVGQKTTIRGANEAPFNGLVTVTEIVNSTTFKYLPLNDIPPAIATIDIWHDKIRCDAGAIKIKRYVSQEFTAVAPKRPICLYSDERLPQHRFDTGIIDGFVFDGIDFAYIGINTGETVGTPNCFFIYREGKEGITIKNSVIDGYRVAIYPNNKLGVINDITIDNVVIVNNWIQGFMGNPDFSVIRDSVFKGNGHNNLTGGSNKLHNIYLSNCNNTKVQRCDLSESAMNAGKASGTELVIHGVCSNLLIEDNYIHNALGAVASGNYGMGINSGYNTPESFTNIIVRRNKIENVGKRSISCNAWIGGLVEENEIINDQPVIGHNAIVFNPQRITVGTPATDGVSILNNYISGTSVTTDIDTQVGTNFTIEKPAVNTPPPTETSAPTVKAPADVTVTATGISTPVNIGIGTAIDNMDGVLIPTSNDLGSYPVATTQVTWTAIDSDGNVGTDKQLITVTQTQTSPPAISS
ncbi:MAG: hypothetical protein ACC657_07115 [Thiohalomonadales bacterium]